ncbi:RICIN domain-containing protein [Streptomyces achromogenes]|uniref:RICIN domain-containing protein n=1 Tax=Streptomyces achromogenes TaxID=67255 RepID=UPI0033C9B0A0
MTQRVKLLQAALLSLATTGALLSASAAGTAAADGPGVTGTGTRVTKAAPRAADPVQTFRNLATGRCLDDSSAGVRTFGCNQMDFQKWEVHVFQDNTRRLRNIATGQCLASGGGRLTMRGCDSSREVSWLVGRGGGGLTFKNQASGTCLDDSSIGLRLFACNQLNFQAWQ